MDAMAMMMAERWTAMAGSGPEVFHWVEPVRGWIWLAVLAGLILLAAQRKPRWCWYPWLAAAVMAAACSWYIGQIGWSRSAMLLAVVCVIGWARTRRE